IRKELCGLQRQPLNFFLWACRIVFKTCVQAFRKCMKIEVVGQTNKLVPISKPLSERCKLPSWWFHSNSGHLDLFDTPKINTGNNNNKLATCAQHLRKVSGPFPRPELPPPPASPNESSHVRL